jgi:hypothetical protein
MHELLRLNGILKDYPIPEREVQQFADAMAGCGEYMGSEAFDTVYNSMAAAVHQQMVLQGKRIGDLNMVLSMEELARLIYETTLSLQNSENEVVVLQGTRNGLFVAALFACLRPKEVEVLVRSHRVYPMPSAGDHIGNSQIRLSILLEETDTGGLPSSSWMVRT